MSCCVIFTTSAAPLRNLHVVVVPKAGARGPPGGTLYAFCTRVRAYKMRTKCAGARAGFFPLASRRSRGGFSRRPAVRIRCASAPRRVFLRNELPRRGTPAPARGACDAFGRRLNWSGVAPADPPKIMGNGRIGEGGALADRAAVADSRGKSNPVT